MNRIIDIAAFTTSTYKQLTGKQMTEKKLHSLLYLIQRETLAISNQPAFKEPMEGWVYGPASREVRSWFQSGKSNSRVKEPTNEIKHIINCIIDIYGKVSDQKLSNLTRTETSWLKAREGLGKKEAGTKYLELEDIRYDAEKIRPFDPIWGMYYDEFEDFRS